MPIFDKIEKEKYSDIWNTPKEITDRLGMFDLDPCASEKRKWDIAKNSYTIKDDGLLKEWKGRVWLNPPYSKAKLFMKKMAIHNNGIAFIYTRVETKMFFEFVYPHATAIFFFKGRVKCYDKNYKQNTSPPASNCLIAYGNENKEALKKIGIDGFYFEINNGHTTAIIQNG